MRLRVSTFLRLNCVAKAVRWVHGAARSRKKGHRPEAPSCRWEQPSARTGREYAGSPNGRDTTRCAASPGAIVGIGSSAVPLVRVCADAPRAWGACAEQAHLAPRLVTSDLRFEVLKTNQFSREVGEITVFAVCGTFAHENTHDVTTGEQPGRAGRKRMQTPERSAHTLNAHATANTCQRVASVTARAS